MNHDIENDYAYQDDDRAMTADDPARLTAIRALDNRCLIATGAPCYERDGVRHRQWEALEPKDWCETCTVSYLLAEIARLQTERDEALLKLRLYENGDNVNQPLVDDVERWRVESERAIAKAEASRLAAMTAKAAAEAARDEAQRERDELKNELARSAESMDLPSSVSTRPPTEKG